jgi:YVTN family beta-propeller protein
MPAALDRRKFALLASGALAACRPRKAQRFPGYALVANSGGAAVAVVDLSAFAVVRHIRLDGGPAALEVDQRRAAVYALVPQPGSIHEIRLGELAAGRRLRIAEEAISMRLAPSGDRLWLLARRPPRLVGIDTESLQVIRRIDLAAPPLDFDLAPNSAQASVSLGGAGLALVELAAEARPRLVRPSASCGPLRYRSDGRLLLVGDPIERLLAVLEAGEGRTVVKLPLGLAPAHFCFKDDGGQLFISGPGMDAVVTVYPYRTEVGSTTLAGRAPGFLAVSTDPDYLFVANPATNDVTVLDIETQRVVAVVTVGKEPGFITVTPDNEYALVLNRASGDMAVIRIATLAGRRRRFAPLFTLIPVGSRPVAAVVTEL